MQLISADSTELILSKGISIEEIKIELAKTLDLDETVIPLMNLRLKTGTTPRKVHVDEEIAETDFYLTGSEFYYDIQTRKEQVKTKVSLLKIKNYICCSCLFRILLFRI